MSKFTAHQHVDIRQIQDLNNPKTTQSSTHYSETENGYTWNLHGTNFSFDRDGYLLSGNVTQIDTARDGHPHFVVEGPVFSMESNVYDAGLTLGGVTLFGMTAEVASWLAGDDTVTGSAAGDVLSGFGGSDAIDGGAGVDTVVFYGGHGSFEFGRNADGSVTVRDTAGSQGTDTLVNVERLQFGDGTVAFDTAGNAGMAYRLYQAAFNRTPDTGGLGYQTNVLDQGHSIFSVASNFINSPEFQSTYGALSNEQFVTQLYQNVLHRAPDEGGLTYHTGNLAAGMSRAEVLVGFSESPENQAALMGTISQGMFFTN